MYGLECCSLTSKSLDILEATHYQSARRLQGLSRQRSVVVPLATLGWLSIRSMLHIAQLLLIHRLLALPAMSFMRRLAITRLIYHLYDSTGKHSGPLCESLKTSEMYKVDNIVKEIMYNPCSISHDQRCKQVEKIVYQREKDVWIVRKGMYKNTVIFNYCITNIEMWCWWKVSSVDPSLGYMVRLVLRLISGEHILACNTARWIRETPIM